MNTPHLVLEIGPLFESITWPAAHQEILELICCSKNPKAHDWRFPTADELGVLHKSALVKPGCYWIKVLFQDDMEAATVTITSDGKIQQGESPVNRENIHFVPVRFVRP